MKERLKMMKKYFRKKNGVEVKEVTETINEDIDKIVKRAKSLILNEKISKPFILRGPNLLNKDIKYRLNKDENENYTVDYNNSIVTLIFLGEKTLHYYQTDITHNNGKINEEISGSVLFKNITSSELEVDNEVTDKGLPLLSVVNLVLTLKNETELTFNLRNHYSFDEEKYPEVLTKDEKYIVKVINDAIEI